MMIVKFRRYETASGIIGRHTAVSVYDVLNIFQSVEAIPTATTLKIYYACNVLCCIMYA